MPDLKIESKTKLHYTLLPGEADRPYLVFLHEGLGCIEMWGDFPKQLCRKTGCPGLLYDRQGYGKSSSLQRSRSVHYIHDYALTELPAILDRVIPDKPVVLIGHSDGGSIALIYGADRPHQLKGIVTEAAHVFVDEQTIAGIRRAEVAWNQGKLQGLSRYHGDKTETIFKEWSETWLSEWFFHWNIEYLLPSIEVPLLVIQGREDHYGSRAQVDSIVTRSSGKAQQYIVDNCGHIPHAEARQVVLQAMSEFIIHLCGSLPSKL